jgi:hypothetical protein
MPALGLLFSFLGGRTLRLWLIAGALAALTTASVYLWWNYTRALDRAANAETELQSLAQRMDGLVRSREVAIQASKEADARRASYATLRRVVAPKEGEGTHNVSDFMDRALDGIDGLHSATEGPRRAGD